MEINSRKNETAIILDIYGDVDLYNAPDLVNMIHKLAEKEKCKIIINLKDVFYIDSSGIGAIISGLLHVEENSGELKIIHISAAVKKIFELTNLISFFDIYDSEEKAIKSFKN